MDSSSQKSSEYQPDSNAINSILYPRRPFLPIPLNMLVFPTRAKIVQNVEYNLWSKQFLSLKTEYHFAKLTHLDEFRQTAEKVFILLKLCRIPCITLKKIKEKSEVIFRRMKKRDPHKTKEAKVAEFKELPKKNNKSLGKRSPVLKVKAGMAYSKPHP